jgi:hypothetical protein
MNIAITIPLSNLNISHRIIQNLSFVFGLVKDTTSQYYIHEA